MPQRGLLYYGRNFDGGDAAAPHDDEVFPGALAIAVVVDIALISRRKTYFNRNDSLNLLKSDLTNNRNGMFTS